MLRIVILFAALLVTVPARAEGPITSDADLVPGGIPAADTSAICQPGHTKTVRPTSSRLKATVYREYGINRRHGRR